MGVVNGIENMVIYTDHDYHHERARDGEAKQYRAVFG